MFLCQKIKTDINLCVSNTKFNIHTELRRSHIYLYDWPANKYTYSNMCQQNNIVQSSSGATTN